MPANKKSPLRMCVSCRLMKDKREMLRVVKNAEGEVFADPGGKAHGRGAYICGDGDCLKKLRRGKILNKAFSCPVSESVYDDVERIFSEKGKDGEKQD